MAMAMAAAAQSSGDIGLGKRLYQDKATCGFCHGWSGDGAGDPQSPGKAANLRETKLDHDQLVEVIVDQTSGEIAKADPITGGDDLTEAKKQNEGMFRATRELREAVKEAKRDNPGYNAVSVWSEMKDNHSVATVTLVKDNDWKTAVIDLTVYKPLIKE